MKMKANSWYIEDQGTATVNSCLSIIREKTSQWLSADLWSVSDDGCLTCSLLVKAQKHIGTIANVIFASSLRLLYYLLYYLLQFAHRQHYRYITAVLASLHWLLVSSRIDFKILLITFWLQVQEWSCHCRQSPPSRDEAQDIFFFFCKCDHSYH